ncbi:restriction endonuclease subunit S [Escherichia coli]|uniref:restriction endonuclease subunit S n=1 Tax=Escherichia coli TaxID=562 RepID=UPI00208DD0FD|nr:restriction endonuclease subunit S [Escherichia coli]EFN6190960.1 restriction endonuclease subunit S [Escherichia coli]MBF8839101.1 restriction endonuclease subunit S [Escherichia coli]MCU9692116.1 restriction endonuclease subunit S [Escherichia coli]
MVPKGWLKYSVGELCTSIVPGRNKPKVFDGDIPWVTTPEINGRYIPSKLQVNYVSTTALSDAGGKIVPQGAVVMAAVGELGLIAITSEPVVLNQQLHAFVCSKLVNNEYLAYWLTTQKPYMESIASKTTIPYMNKANCESIPVLLPPLAEQFKIAQILLTWDKAISVTEKLLANSQQQKKALMQQLLTGKKRLLDENGVRFSGEWKRVKLGAIADMNSGGTPKSTVEEYYGGNIPWVSISDMTSNGKWIATTEKYLTELGLNSSSARIYPKNSVLYAMYASIGECSIAAVNLTSSQAILGIRPKDCLNYEFLYFYLTSLKEKIKLQGQQGTQSNLNAGMVKEFELDLPSIREQQKIAAVLSAADAEISTLEKKLACLRDEKKALMQQLLTGKRRVKVDEAVAE